MSLNLTVESFEKYLGQTLISQQVKISIKGGHTGYQHENLIVQSTVEFQG